MGRFIFRRALKAPFVSFLFAVLASVCPGPVCPSEPALFDPESYSSENIPVDAILSVPDARLVQADSRPIRYWVVAAGEFKLQFQAQSFLPSGTSLLELEIELPEGLELVTGNRKIESTGPDAALACVVRPLRTGEFLVTAHATDAESGFTTASSAWIIVAGSEGEVSAAAERAPELFVMPMTHVVDARAGAASLGAPEQPLAVPANYAHISGIAYTYPYGDGNGYMLRGIQVELWERPPSSPDTKLATVYTVEPTSDADYGLTPSNYVSGGVWTHVDDSGTFDFGNVYVGPGGKDLYVAIVYIFHDGGDGTTGGGTEKLTILDDTSPSDAVVALQFPVARYSSGQDPGRLGLPAPALGTAGTLGDEAAHIFYDLVKAYTYFRNLTGYSSDKVTTYINYPSTISPYSQGLVIKYNGWTNNYLIYEKTDSLLHEYSHSIQFAMRGGSFPPYTPCLSGSCGGGNCVGGDCNHGGCKNATSSDGLAEGWARFVPPCILKDPIYRWGSSNSPWDIRPNTGQNGDCDKSEWTVGAVLWDVVSDVGGGAPAWFDHVADTLRIRDPDYVQDYYSGLVADWGYCSDIWNTFRNHNVTYPSGPPSAPSGLSATEKCADVTLAWSPAGGASSYTIYRAPVDCSGTFALLHTTTSASYTDATGDSGALYGYKVVAANSCGDSPDSSCVRAGRQVQPSAPDGVSAAGECSQIAVTWNAASQATSYRIYRASGGCAGSFGYLGNASSPVYEDASASPGTTYGYEIKSSNDCGDSGLSGCSAAARLAAPAAPAGLSADASCSGIALAWDSMTGATSYKVYRAAGGCAGSFAFLDTASSAAYTDESALPGAPYGYKVKSSNACGDSAAYSSCIEAAKPATPPSAPSGVAAGDACNGIDVTWDAVGDATSYKIYRAAGGCAGGFAYLDTSSEAGYLDASAAVGTAYGYKVKASNGCGDSGESGCASGVRSNAPPAPPSGVGADESCSRNTVTWSPSSGATSYKLYRTSSDGCAGTFIYLGSTTSSSYPDTSAVPGIAHGYRVLASGACGDSGDSSCVTALRQCTGDVNCDCRADVGDSLLILQKEVGLRACSDPVYCGGCSGWDVNCDGFGDIGDALLILQKEVGLRNCDAVAPLCVNVCNPVCTIPQGGQRFLYERAAARGGIVSVRAGEVPKSLVPGRAYSFPIVLDAAGRPLGGYVLEAAYDPGIVRIESISGGLSPEFSEPPLSDEATYASGRTRFAAVNLRSLDAAEEAFQVAVLAFRLLEMPQGGEPLIVLTPLSVKDTSGLEIDSAGSFEVKQGGATGGVLRNRNGDDREGMSPSDLPARTRER
jgi:fibronectin type 3 domain-containing protein